MIVPTTARLLLREHLYRPIRGRVLQLGRQTVAMTHGQVMDVFRQEGYSPPDRVAREAITRHDERTRVGKGTLYIGDDTFFALLGIEDVVAMDVSAYEGADIVHDLNYPVPESLHGQFDFIIDGGTFDHLFDLRVAFENVVKLLKPDGRILQWNAASNFTGAAYISFGPDFFYDYYVVNQFADCRVYVAEVDDFRQQTMWDFYLYEGTDKHGFFPTSRIQLVVVIAEKAADSTWHRMPVQAQYRDADRWEPYREGQRRIAASARQPLASALSRAERYRLKGVGMVGKLKRKIHENGILGSMALARTRGIKFLKRETKVVKPRNVQGFRFVGSI